MNRLLAMLMLGLLAACATPQAATPDATVAESKTAAESQATPEAASGEVDYSCATDADCEVKNVGNCCGYYPACVNRDSETFPEQVKAACAAEGRMSVCGFEEISSCQCRAGRCEAAPGTGSPLQDR